MKPKVAIVCDWLVSQGGAERVISALAKLYPEAPIYTSIFNAQKLPEFKNVIPSWPSRIPFAQKRHHYFLPLMPYVFEQLDLSEYDIVISSSHSCAKGVITKPETLHICYCHSPMRYCWDGCHDYFERFGISRLFRPIAKKLLYGLRQWDRVSSDRVDSFVANSRHVQDRIKKYYRRDSAIIYPPVDTDFFTPAETTADGKYFLAIGRLTPYKRFDLVIDVFNELKLPLIIVGTGIQEKILKRRAGRYITFLGQISDEELKTIYQGAKALVFPQSEDFGITPIEAMACGVPVIAFADGGALETIIPKTGLLFESQTAAALKAAILDFEKISWDQSFIRNHAMQFSKSRFEREFKDFVDDRWECLSRRTHCNEIPAFAGVTAFRQHQSVKTESIPQPEEQIRA